MLLPVASPRNSQLELLMSCLCSRTVSALTVCEYFSNALRQPYGLELATWSGPMRQI